MCPKIPHSSTPMAEITFQEEAGGSKIHQILVKFLDGNHKFLNFETPIIAVEDLKRRIQTLTLIPSHHQLLLLHGDEGVSRPTLLPDDRRQTLSLVGMKFPAVVHLLLRLRGGKGGFGSLLRGAASKAGQKKTNNFDACRDMSGRRMRHVNAERRLEEWVAEAEERKLEKVAEDYIKKINKEMVKKGKGKGGGDVEKYVQKYREDSEKCREEVDRAVRESLKGLVASKRKFSAKDKGVESKRLRIWFGKRKLGDGDSEGMDEDDSDKNEDGENKSVVLDDEGPSNLSKDREGTPGSVINTQHDMVSSDSGPSGSCSDEEKTGFEESPESDESRIANEEAASLDESKLGISEEQTFQHGDNLLLPTTDGGTASVLDEKKVSNESNLSKLDKSVCQITVLSSSGLEEATAVGASTIQYGDVTIVEEPVNLEKPLNFEEVNSAAELEVLGLETLKTELQSRGLKCGGTLQERAARLFLLKTTPLEMIPKKLFAKK